MTAHPLLSSLEEIAPTFAPRSAEHDRTGEFVSENYETLKAKKLFSAGVPKELGGGGASHAELCEMVRTIAHHCPSTALAFSMHTHLVAAAVWRHLHGQPAAPLLSKIAANEVILVSTGAGDWLDSTGKAEKVDGGYRVTAQKRFASGSPGANLILTTAPYQDPKEGATVLHFGVAVNADGVRIGNDWDTLGMRGTGSHTLTLESVFVPEEGISMRRPQGKWHPAYEVICVVALPIVMSAYVGIAEHAAQLATDGARKHAEDPGMPFLLGELTNARITAQMALREAVGLTANYDFKPSAERASDALVRKTICARACQETVAKAVEVAGGGAFFRKNLLEQLWRDVQGAQFHPLPEKRQQLLTGRVALGLPPY